MEQPRIIMINLNLLSPQTIVKMAKDIIKEIANTVVNKQSPESYLYELRAIFYTLREHLDGLKGKGWVDNNLPISDWSMI